MAGNFMYGAKYAGAQVDDRATKMRQLRRAQDARTRQQGRMSLWSTIGTGIGAAFGGPIGAAIGGGLGSWGADAIDPAEKHKGPERGLFMKSEAQDLRDQLRTADRAQGMEHVATGLKSGASAYAFGRAGDFGGFGEAPPGETYGMLDKLSKGFLQ